MMAVVKSGLAFFSGDDCVPSAAWQMQRKDLPVALLRQLLEDPSWRIKHDLSTTDVLTHIVARDSLGLSS